MSRVYILVKQVTWTRGKMRILCRIMIFYIEDYVEAYLVHQTERPYFCVHIDLAHAVELPWCRNTFCHQGQRLAFYCRPYPVKNKSGAFFPCLEGIHAIF